MKIPAYIVLRLIAVLLAIFGVALLVAAGIYFLSSELVLSDYGLTFPIIGLFLLFVALLGPVRVMIRGAQIPIEIKHTIAIQAVLLPLSAVALIASAFVDLAVYDFWIFIIVGSSALISALAGLYPLSKRLPSTFYIHEMISIIKSAGITGDKLNSQANKAFQLWSTGRNGVPVGDNAPVKTVITMDGEEVLLSTFFSDKPLVLNLGSYSCPHHRKRIHELNELVDKWQPRGVDFLTIYTAEAHAEDGWKLVDQYVDDDEYTNEGEFCFPYARNLDERNKIARWLIDKKNLTMPVVLDSMNNCLLKAYNSWPIRLYIIIDRKIVYCGEQGPFGYLPSRVDAALQRLLNM